MSTSRVASLCVDWLGAVGLTTLLCLGGAVRAQDDISVSVSSTVALDEAPAVTLTVRKPLQRAVLDLQGKGPGAPKRRVRVSGGPVQAGQKLQLTLPTQHKAGVIRWEGNLSVRFQDGGQGAMPLVFQTQAASPPTIELVEGGLDLAGHTITVRMNRPAKAVDLEVLGDDGQLIANINSTFNGEPAGTPLVLRWVPRSDAKVMRLRLVGHDTAGFFSAARDLHPWSLHLPHEEIVFASGEAVLAREEEPKLMAVLPELKKRTTQYRGLIDVKLYIMGHTDTVGSQEQNEALSQNRARTIAKWFRKKGVGIPIFARGLGEAYLEVLTPDETDALKNRRVDYVLAVEQPLPGRWEKIR